MIAVLLAGASGGCVAPGPIATDAPAERSAAPGPPRIVAFTVDCNVDTDAWTLTAEADAWTGGGIALMSADLAYVEQHPVQVIASAPGGDREDLELKLGVAADWRAQTPGQTTVFTCADAPTVAFSLLDLQGKPADCRLAGPLASALASQDGVDCVVADEG